MKPDMTKETSMRSDKHKFLAYKKYKAFHDSIKIILGDENRKIDKAFFAFGQFSIKIPTLSKWTSPTNILHQSINVTVIILKNGVSPA